MKVPFFDMKRVHEHIKEDISRAVNQTLDDGSFILGPAVELFEREFASYVTTKFACGVDNGTSALELILRALNIGEGNEVITTPASFIASSSAIAFTGATPIFVDIDSKTYTINPEKIEEKITSKTKAILPIHLYGQPADMDHILAIAERHNLVVIEDACEALGASFKGKKVGSFGIAAAFSFYPSKNLGGLGDGGIVTSSSEQIIERIKSLRNYSQKTKYHHDEISFNRRLDSIQAAVLNVKLPMLDKHNLLRKEAAELYDSLLANTSVKVPDKEEKRDHVYYVYCIQSEKRHDLETYLNQNNIQTGKHFPIPIHLQKAFSYLKHSKGDFPETEKLSSCCLSLPLFPGITQKEIKYVAEKILEFEKKENSSIRR